MTHTPAPGTGREILVIGGGPAAHRLVQKLIQRGLGEDRVTVLAEEPWSSYDRVALETLFNDPYRDLSLGGPEFWEHPQVTLHTDMRASDLDVKGPKGLRDARADRQPRRAARGSGAPAAGLPLQREVLVPPRSQAPSAQDSGRMVNPHLLDLHQNRRRCPRSGSDPCRKADMSPKIAEVDELPHSGGHRRPDVGRRRDHCEPLCACAALDDACGSCASKIDTSTWRAQSITAASVRSLPPTRAVLGLGIRT